MLTLQLKHWLYSRKEGNEQQAAAQRSQGRQVALALQLKHRIYSRKEGNEQEQAPAVHLGFERNSPQVWFLRRRGEGCRGAGGDSGGDRRTVGAGPAEGGRFYFEFWKPLRCAAEGASPRATETINEGGDGRCANAKLEEVALAKIPT